MSLLTLNERVLKLGSSATLAMKARAKALTDRGISVMTLSAGEPDFDTPQVIKEAAKKALDKGISRYTGVRGSDDLIHAMRIKFERDQKVRYDASQVLSTVGAKSAISQAIDALIGAGDEVIVFSPYWVSYTELISLAGGTPVLVHASKEQGYVPTPEQLRAAITPRTKAIILNSPNNPSGAVFSEAALRGLMDVVKDSKIWVISDEIYEHLLFDNVKHVSPASFSDDAYSRTLVITGASKAYAMTGWRVGVVGGPKELVGAMVKLQEQRYTCIATVAQAACAYALLEPPEVKAEIEKMRQAYEMRRNKTLEIVASMPGVTCFKPQGAFYVLLDFSSITKDDQVLADRLLDEAHVALVAGSAFGVPGTVRMSLASSMETITEGLTRIRKWL